MKIKVLVMFVCAVFIAASALAFDTVYMGYSTVKTDDASIHTGSGYLYGIVAATDGSNSVTFKTYDNTSGTGTKMHPDWIATTSSTNRMSYISFDPPIPFSTGCYVDITTSGAVSYVVYYRGK